VPLWLAVAAGLYAAFHHVVALRPRS